MVYNVGDTVKTKDGVGTVVDVLSNYHVPMLKVIFANGHEDYFGINEVIYIASMKDISMAIANMD